MTSDPTLGTSVEYLDAMYEREDLRLCVGHDGWIAAVRRDPKFFEYCGVHDMSSDDSDATLRLPVVPVAYFPKKLWRAVLLVGGRNELLELRDDIDAALEKLP